MRLSIDVLLDYELPQTHDVLLQIEAAAMADQWIEHAELRVTSPEPLLATPGDESIGQRTWAIGIGRFTATYRAQVVVSRADFAIDALPAVPPRALPGLVVPYLLPSRYVGSDRFESFVERRFGQLSGGAKIAAMRDWIEREVSYVSGSSTGETSAGDTFVRREGVCRDYAHLLAAFARAGGIPARLVSVYAPGVDPPDFHAVVEVWLDHGWWLVDATGMVRADRVARIAVGRDATDIAFMTVFGSAMLIEQRVAVSEIAATGGAT